MKQTIYTQCLVFYWQHVTGLDAHADLLPLFSTVKFIIFAGRATTFGQDSDGGSMDHGGGHNMGSMGTMEETDPSMEEMDHDMMGDGTGDRRAGMGDMLDGMQGDSDHGMMDSMADNSDDGKVFVPHSVFRYVACNGW